MPRLVLPSPHLLRRTVRTEAISRLLLDINASYNADQNSAPREPAEAVTKSDAATRGESMRGDVTLPRELQEAVDNAIEGEEGGDKPTLRINALSLYSNLRATAAILPPPSSFRDRQALSTTYDSSTSLAYLAGLMPSIYGATLNVLTMTKSRLAVLSPSWEPDRLVDWGSGTASAAWAFQEVWGRKDKIYVGLDGSKAMIELSSSILGALDTELDTGDKLFARSYQLPIPCPDSALAKMGLSPKSSSEGSEKGKKTIALAAFTLRDLGTRERRKDLVRCMWESGAQVIVLVERGTPAGSRMIQEARLQLLGYGRKSLDWPEEVDGPQKGCFVLAPCPHDGACPIFNDTKSYCHFSQRVRSPPFLRHTKHTTRGEDDAKFSYLVIRRGERPIGVPPPVPRAIKTGVELEDQPPLERPSGRLPEVDGKLVLAEAVELAWPRIVSPPIKRSGHVVLEVCSASGSMERHNIPRSQGRQEYYDARKSAWGDSFPHAPKNGATLAPMGKEVSPRDKFGEGKSQVRSKKAERSSKWVRDELVPKKERRRGKKTSEADQEGDDEEYGDGSGVKDYELEFGTDGELKIVN